MEILQSMRVFVRVVEAGSFTAAANGMDITPGQASLAGSQYTRGSCHWSAGRTRNRPDSDLLGDQRIAQR